MRTKRGQVARHVDQHDERDTECVAHAHEAGRLLGRGRVQTAAQPHRVVRHDADGSATETAQGGRYVGSPLGVQLDIALGVIEDVGDQRVHIVGASSRLRERLGEVAILN